MEPLTELKFGAALDIVAGTGRRIKYGGGCWNTLNHCDDADSINVGCQLSNSVGEPWWPSPNERSQKAWEVEPEKVGEVFVWGYCDDLGYCRIDCYEEVNNNDALLFPADTIRNIFPDITRRKNKPQKYRLVPVEQKPDEYEKGFKIDGKKVNFNDDTKADIPWKPFVAEDMPKLTFGVLVYTVDGEKEYDTWAGKILVNHLHKYITHYCKISDLNKPGDTPQVGEV